MYIFTYQEWNQEKGYPDEVITDDKFLLFLSEIHKRRPKKRGRKNRNGSKPLINR